MNAQRQFFLGVFFLVALSILAFYTLFLTDFSSIWGEQIVVTADFPEAHGLREGDPVLVAGKRIGRVRSIDFDPQAPPVRRIRIVMHLDEQVEILTGYRIAIQESTFLGGRHVDIDPGPGGAAPLTLIEGEVLAGVVDENPIAALESIGNLVAENSETVTSVLENVDAILAQVRAGEGVVGRLIYDEEMGQELADSVTDFRASVASLREVSESIQRGEGALGRLVVDDTLYERAVSLFDDLALIAADLKAGKGALGSLVYDQELESELERIVSNVDAITTGLANGEGALGKILSDPELAEELAGIITNFHQASADIQGVAANLRGTEGTLGLLMNDRELYDEALTAVKLMTRSLEDYREAAPVSAFTGVLFGAF